VCCSAIARVRVDRSRSPADGLGRSSFCHVEATESAGLCTQHIYHDCFHARQGFFLSSSTGQILVEVLTFLLLTTSASLHWTRFAIPSNNYRMVECVLWLVSCIYDEAIGIWSGGHRRSRHEVWHAKNEAQEPYGLPARVGTTSAWDVWSGVH
jgi:hypothetical protein